MPVLSEMQWRLLDREHRELVVPWIESYRKRRGLGKSHPVYDFLFGYYQMNRQKLIQWRPMSSMRLEGDGAKRFLEDERYTDFNDGVGLDAQSMSTKEVERIQWVANLISLSLRRAPRFNCYGLHEWAMVYRSDQIRYESTPLRLPSEQIEEVVRSMPICCTHYDAFRFFTEDAKPLNAQILCQDERADVEQFGCVHFNMDLYRWSYKLCPWIGSELMDDCFKLAIEARTLDMRASPYDLSKYGFEPIRIETQSGRNEYSAEQQVIYEKGQPLAKRLLSDCENLLRKKKQVVNRSVAVA